MEGNKTLALGVSGILDPRSGSVVPAPYIDALWNDKIDTWQNAKIQMTKLVDVCATANVDGTMNLDLSRL